MKKILRAFSEEDVKKPLWAFGADKAPGPNSFSMLFSKTAGIVLEATWWKSLIRFFLKGKLALTRMPPVSLWFLKKTDLLESFIFTWIPPLSLWILKKTDLFWISYFQLISLVTDVYKIIMNMLTIGLSELLNEHYYWSECSFFSLGERGGRKRGRQIVDAFLNVNDLVEDVRKSKGSGLSWNWILRRLIIVSIVLFKKNDRVNSSFLDKFI